MILTVGSLLPTAGSTPSYGMPLTKQQKVYDIIPMEVIMQEEQLA